MRKDQKGIAFITGATSGIGKAFAEAFASQGHNLIITGRRHEKINSVADSIRKKYSVNVEVIIAELSDEKQLEKLIKKVRSIDNLEVLVNNAGFAKIGTFNETDINVHRTMLMVHSNATMELTHAALPAMIKNKKGSIINLSSIGSFLPLPGNAVYSATKAFVSSLTEIIHFELSGTGVKVQALCPGMTITDFHEKMGFSPKKFYKTKGMTKAMSPEEVVKISLSYLEKDKPICIPGFNNRITYFATRFLPRKVLYKLIVSSFRK